MNDISQPIQLRSSPTKLVALVLLGLLMTVLSAAVGLRWFSDIPPWSFARIVGLIGIPFCGLYTVVAAARLFRLGQPVIKIFAEGVFDRRISEQNDSVVCHQEGVNRDGSSTKALDA